MAPLLSPAVYVGSNAASKVYLGAQQVWSSFSYDADAAAYITAVETADGQTLEQNVKLAINSFVVGCKADGIWSAIKAACILAGARTLAGALVPLVGSAPTNYNFVAGDYNRETGLVGDGSTKYLDSNRLDSADPQNNYHLSTYIGSAASTGDMVYMGTTIGATSYSILQRRSAGTITASARSTLADVVTFGSSSATGFLGSMRPSSLSYSYRASGVTGTKSTSSSAAPPAINTFVFARNLQGTGAQVHSDARLSFYSIGESLDLALLDSRVTALVNEVAFYLNTGLNPTGYDIDTLKYINAGYAAGGSLS